MEKKLIWSQDYLFGNMGENGLPRDWEVEEDGSREVMILEVVWNHYKEGYSLEWRKMIHLGGGKLKRYEPEMPRTKRMLEMLREDDEAKRMKREDKE